MGGIVYPELAVFRAGNFQRGVLELDLFGKFVGQLNQRVFQRHFAAVSRRNADAVGDNVLKVFIGMAGEQHLAIFCQQLGKCPRLVVTLCFVSEVGRFFVLDHIGDNQPDKVIRQLTLPADSRADLGVGVDCGLNLAIVCIQRQHGKLGIRAQLIGKQLAHHGIRNIRIAIADHHQHTRLLDVGQLHHRRSGVAAARGNLAANRRGDGVILARVLDLDLVAIGIQQDIVLANPGRIAFVQNAVAFPGFLDRRLNHIGLELAGGMGQQFIQGALEALLGVLADLGGNGVGRAGKGGDPGLVERLQHLTGQRVAEIQAER